MTVIEKSITEKADVAAVLIESIKHYRQIVALLQDVNLRLGAASPGELQGMGEAIDWQQQQAGMIDGAVLARLHEEPVEMARYQSLMLERAGLLQEMVTLNGRIAGRARDVASMLVHELEGLRNGQSALSGYRLPIQEGGRLVNGIY
jgi:hypothetical protein